MKTRVCLMQKKEQLSVEMQEVGQPSAGEVRLAIGVGGICGSDLHYYFEGGIGEAIRVKEPIIFGHEVAGTVESVGEGVAELSVGDRVALNPSTPCGQCDYCAAELAQHCLSMRFLGSAIRFPHEQGAFRDLINNPAIQCVKLDKAVSLAEGACAEPLAVVLHAASRAGDLQGKKVLITGAGPIGSLCVAVANHLGAAETVVTDLQDKTLAVAKAMGASKTINVISDSAALDVYNKDKGYFDLVFECSAAEAAIASAIAATRPLGTIVQVGVAGGTELPLNLLVGKEINFIGSHRFTSEFAQAVEWINQRVVDVKPMITHEYPLEQAQQAFETARDRSQSVKVQLVFG